MFDKLLEFVTNTAIETERRKWQDREREADEAGTKHKHHGCFHADVKAGDLIEPCKKNAEHHRVREKHYTKALERAEKTLRTKGVSMEVFDPMTQTFQNYGNSVGNVASGLLPTSNLQPSMQQQFKPRVDQKLMDACTNAKSKMMEHRLKAETFEKQGRAFAFNPDFKIRLSVEDIHYFRLEK